MFSIKFVLNYHVIRVMVPSHEFGLKFLSFHVFSTVVCIIGLENTHARFGQKHLSYRNSIRRYVCHIPLLSQSDVLIIIIIIGPFCFHLILHMCEWFKRNDCATNIVMYLGMVSNGSENITVILLLDYHGYIGHVPTYVWSLSFNFLKSSFQLKMAFHQWLQTWSS